MKTNLYSNLELVIESTSNRTKGNSANYKKLSNWNMSKNGNVTSIGTNGDGSYYDIYDMGGQVYEWTDTDASISGYKIVRGGCFADTEAISLSKNSYKNFPIDYMIKDGFFGFRLASSGNPYSYNNYEAIGNTGNISDNCGQEPIGTVNYTYQMMSNLVTNDEYCNFLNTMDISGINSNKLYDTNMQYSPVGGIYLDECASTGNKYKIKTGMENKPVTFIKWTMAAKYTNWMNSNQNTNTSVLYSGTYNLLSTTGINRNNSSLYFLPNNNEWYKAAYYDPTITGYWNYPTQSDDVPYAVVSDTTGLATGVEKQYLDTKVFPILIRGDDSIVSGDISKILYESSLDSNLYGKRDPQFSENFCPSITLSSTDTSGSLVFIDATLSNLNINESYSYNFTSIASNWPCDIEPISGTFTASESSKNIKAVLKFCPEDRYNFFACQSRLTHTDEPNSIKSYRKNYIYNTLQLSLETKYCNASSDYIKIQKTIGDSGIPSINQRDCTSIKILSPSGEPHIDVSGSLCEEFIPIVISVTNAIPGERYRFLLDSPDNTIFVPTSGIVSFGSGVNKITSYAALNGDSTAILEAKLSRLNIDYSAHDYMSLRCLKECSISTGNYVNFDNKAIWGICLDCDDGKLRLRNFADVTTVGSNGTSSDYGTFDQDGNIEELCHVGDPEIDGSGFAYRGGHYASSSVGKNSRTLATSSSQLHSVSANSPGKYPYHGFRIGSYTNSLNLPNMVQIKDVGVKPTGNVPDNNGYGSVDYQYYIGQYPVTNNEYAEYLNTVHTLNNSYISFVYQPYMSGCYGGINRTGNGTIGTPFSYAVQDNMNNKPVKYISVTMAQYYINWLESGKTSNPTQLIPSGSYSGTYDVIGNTGLYRKSCCDYFIPSENEWYKAAYYKGTNNGNTSAGYWTYATQSNTLPGSVTANSNGDGVLPN